MVLYFSLFLSFILEPCLVSKYFIKTCFFDSKQRANKNETTNNEKKTLTESNNYHLQSSSHMRAHFVEFNCRIAIILNAYASMRKSNQTKWLYKLNILTIYNSQITLILVFVCLFFLCVRTEIHWPTARNWLQPSQLWSWVWSTFKFFVLFFSAFFCENFNVQQFRMEPEC